MKSSGPENTPVELKVKDYESMSDYQNTTDQGFSPKKEGKKISFS